MMSLAATSAADARTWDDLESPAAYSLVEASGLDALAAHRRAWARLAAENAEPNVFYEPGYLLTLLKHFPERGGIRVVFIYRGVRSSTPELVAVLPLRLERRGPGRLLRRHQLHWDIYIGLCTPLLHRAYGAEALEAVFDWLDCRPHGSGILGLQYVELDGAFGSALREVAARRGQPLFVKETHARAILRPASSAADYLKASLSAKRRMEFRRLRNRLSEQGELRLVCLRPGDDLEPWGEDFLRLEVSGWKGMAGTAFASRDRDAAFFRAVLAEAHRGGQLLMQALVLDGKRIAMKCSLRAAGGEGGGGDGGGAFALKIAYDESFARYSPGVLLELETIRLFHEEPDYPPWMDSCAEPDHAMINRLWPDRREIAYVFCAARRWRYRVLFKALALLTGKAA